MYIYQTMRVCVYIYIYIYIYTYIHSHRHTCFGVRTRTSMPHTVRLSIQERDFYPPKKVQNTACHSRCSQAYAYIHARSLCLRRALYLRTHPKDCLPHTLFPSLSSLHTYMHTHIHTYIHTYILTYILTYHIHTLTAF